MIQAADGDGMAVTGVTFLDGQLDQFHLFDYIPQPDWTIGVCQCCFDPAIVSKIVLFCFYILFYSIT